MVASLVPYDEICIAVQVEEDQIGQISVGDSTALTYSFYGDERLISGTVIEITNVAQNGSYAVWISAKETPVQLDLTVEVRID